MIYQVSARSGRPPCLGVLTRPDWSVFVANVATYPAPHLLLIRIRLVLICAGAAPEEDYSTD